MNLSATYAFSLLFAALAIAAPARGQVVSGSGNVTIEKQPQKMRMSVQLLAKAKTLQEALDALKDRITAARSQVGVLGADKDSIAVGEPAVSEGETEIQKMMHLQLQKQLRKAIRENRKRVAVPVTVTAKLTAEWKLTAKDTRELLLAVHPLIEKVRAADIAGAKEAGVLTAEEQEIFDEVGENYYGEDGVEPGEPVFEFVSKVSDEERDAALAEAFKKAKASAARLAKAAGAKLGGLKSLKSESDNAPAGEDEYGGYYAAMLQASRNSQGSEGVKNPNEAVGDKPGPVSYRVRVNAAFAIQSATGNP